MNDIINYWIIWSEMLTELKPNQEPPADYRLLLDLVATCKEMQTRIVELIGKINNDEITAELLRLNDEINNLFLRYQRYEKNRDPKTASERPSALLAAAIGKFHFHIDYENLNTKRCRSSSELEWNTKGIFDWFKRSSNWWKRRCPKQSIFFFM